MMSKKFIFTVVLSAVTAATTSPRIFAESRWGLGLGAVISDQGYVDIGNEITPVPVIYYQSENFQLLGPNFSYKLTEIDDLAFSFTGQFRFDGYEEDDGDIFLGMDDRSGSFDLGLAITKELIAHYDAEIQVSNNLSLGGAKFIVEFRS